MSSVDLFRYLNFSNFISRSTFHLTTSSIRGKSPRRASTEEDVDAAPAAMVMKLQTW